MPQNALVLVFDRLQAGYLGPYGNNTVPTPAFNALAAESLLLENHLADSNDLASTYRAWWGGGHVWSPDGGPGVASPLPESLEEGAIHTALISDDPAVLEHPLAERFVERIIVEHEADPNHAVEEPTDCRLARVLEAALRWLDDKPPQPFLCWVHAQALAGPWDAPYDMRLALTDDEDPEPPTEVAPPQMQLKNDYNPDELLGITQAYGAQVMLADMCLGMFLDDFMESRASRRTLLACTSPRGYPLGEHLTVGTEPPLLTSEALQTPLILRFPRAEAAAVRERSLVHPADLYATLREWFELEAAPRTSWRQSLIPLRSGLLGESRWQQGLESNTQVGIRTGEWLLVMDREELPDLARGSEFIQLDRQTTSLYAKPDDRGEFNNVYSLCMREAHELAEQLWALRQQIETGQ